MRAVIILTACALLLFGGAFLIYKKTASKAQSFSDLSKMLVVQNIAESALSAHYKQSGRYPNSLSELSLEFVKWGDEGSSAKDLASWHYQSDGQSFTMTWNGPNSRKLFFRGENGRIFHTENTTLKQLQ